MTILEDPVKEINLGFYSTFSLREHYQEPTRCSEYQRYGHHVAKYRGQTRCRICSEPHLTYVCITKYKEGTPATAKWPNCRERHHIWYTGCPERLKCLAYPSGQPIQVEQRTPGVCMWKLYTWNRTLSTATAKCSLPNSATSARPSLPVKPKSSEVQPHHTCMCSSVASPTIPHSM